MHSRNCDVLKGIRQMIVIYNIINTISNDFQSFAFETFKVHLFKLFSSTFLKDPKKWIHVFHS